MSHEAELDECVHPRNSRVYAIGSLVKPHGFKVRRVVWGSLMARTEKRKGEQIRRAFILVEKGKGNK
jgi:hypothetical protein